MFTVPNVMQKIIKEKESSLHRVSIDARVSYSTAHAWNKGTVCPSVESFNEFLNVHGYELGIRKIQTEQTEEVE